MYYSVLSKVRSRSRHLRFWNYILLGNFPLPWTYFCEQKDEIPTPISGSSYVIINKCGLCQCSLSAGSWYLEANIAYCTEDPDNPSTQLTLYYTVNMATVIYQFQEKLKTEGITDLILFTFLMQRNLI